MAEPLQRVATAAAGRRRTGCGTVVNGDKQAEIITLAGHVQGVGLRPFVYRLAVEYGITGHVQNKLGEVEILASGHTAALWEFRRDLVRRAPPLSAPQLVRRMSVDVAVTSTFNIIASAAGSKPQVYVPPDYFMCDDCRHELGDPNDRRYRYPFINCTQCGPRFTLIESMPYDRPNTSMAKFVLCGDCQSEYDDPSNRRFHAEPVACQTCGPELEFTSADAGECVDPLEAALALLRNGAVVAVKGVGGYHLMCDARDEYAVARLRTRKQRPDKPLAIMFPLAGADGLGAVRRYASIDRDEAKLLAGPVRPIVLVRKRAGTALAANVSRNLGEIGAFLPYSPLHQLLLDGFGGPLVATSGNISGEPVLTENSSAAHRLATIADAFLHHNRPIVRPADDSIYRKIAGAMRPLRIGRGTAPREFELPWRQPCPTLAVGAHMKGSVALSWDDRAVVSPHIGEMDSPRSLAVFEMLVDDLQSLYGVRAERIVCDANPAYTTGRWAQRQKKLDVNSVWHHAAHASALAAEFSLGTPTLVFTWDGIGYGEDGTLWGGEALHGEAGHWKRVASLRTFRLPGGDRAGREPWRSAAALAWECGLPWGNQWDDTGLAEDAWQKNINCPETSAAGRLFDAAAAVILDSARTSYEAAGPMMLEALCRVRREPLQLPLTKDVNGIWRSNWRPLLSMLTDHSRNPATRAEIFHASLAEVIVQQAKRVRREHVFEQVGLTGGVFQNRLLTEYATERLQREGFRVLLPIALPCNDASISFGQAAEMAARSVRTGQ